MRVLHVYRTYFPDTQGGLEEAIRQICLATGAHGVRNRVFTLSDHPRPPVVTLPEADVVRVRKSFEVASCGFSTPAGAATFGRIAREHDLIHYHLPWPFADMLHLGGRIRRPALATYHSDVVRQRLFGKLYQPLQQRFLRSMHALVATSPAYVRTSSVLAPLAARVDVIPNTVDPASYPAVDPAVVAGWRARLGDPFFLFIGVLRYYKGLDDLIEAARQLPYPVVIAGEGPEGARLRRKAADAAIGNVHFVGHVSDVDKIALIEASRAIVFPSHLRSEAFGITLLEGAMRCKPLISCEIGTGTSYVNQHGETGFVVPARDSAALASAMRCLAEDREKAGHLGAAARHRFDRLFSSQAVGRSYIELYRRVLCQAAAAA